MSAANQRAVLDAVSAARPIVARLSTDRHREDCAADIIEAWTVVETGLRSLVGGTTLSGQALIRELRQRQFLSLEQANSLAEFNAARDRAARTDYSPTATDMAAVRAAVDKLESGIGDATTVMTPPIAAVAAPPVAEPVVVAPITPVNGRPRGLILGGAIAAVVVLALIGWLVFGRHSEHGAAYDAGVAAYGEGRREAAEGDFRKAITDNPQDPMPHVYLSRIERERGNMNNANAEALKAVELGPHTDAALRELGSVRFALQDYDGARRFYTRAIEADTTDRTSEGYLGCALIRSGRIPEGTKWLDRAGTGAWSSCAPAPGAAGAATPPGVVTSNPSVPMTVSHP